MHCRRADVDNSSLSLFNAKEFAIEILLKNVATEFEKWKKVMTYDMTTPIGLVTHTPNERTCGRAHGNTQNHPKHSKAT